MSNVVLRCPTADICKSKSPASITYGVTGVVYVTYKFHPSPTKPKSKPKAMAPIQYRLYDRNFIIVILHISCLRNTQVYPMILVILYVSFYMISPNGQYSSRGFTCRMVPIGMTVSRTVIVLCKGSILRNRPCILT